MARKKIIWSNMPDGPEQDKKEQENDFEYVQGDLAIKTEGRLIGIADIGRWNGRFTGYAIYGKNIRYILTTECEYAEWYSDGKNIKGKMQHHDGTNYVEYREIREEKNIDNLLEKLYNQEPITRAQINYYTKSIAPYVHKVYGW